MLDIQLLRSNTAAVAERLAARGYEFDTARFNALEILFREACNSSVFT